MEIHYPQFRLQPTQRLAEAVDISEDWTGIADPVVRLKMQNRLNQRARRRRMKPTKWTPMKAKIDDIRRGHQKGPPLTLLECLSGSPNTHVPQMSTAISSEVLNPLNSRRQASNHTRFPISLDHLIPLIHFNVYRAILSNMLLIRHPDVFNCICPEPPRLSALPLPAAFPPSLLPTAVQMNIPHPPWMDLFPVPGIRDTLIRATGKFDDNELCLDTLGMYDTHALEFKPADPTESSAGEERNGMIVWGDPTYVGSWEVTKGFARKWGWIIKDGCEELLRSTNSWRAIRMEEPLSWDDFELQCDG